MRHEAGSRASRRISNKQCGQVSVRTTPISPLGWNELLVECVQKCDLAGCSRVLYVWPLCEVGLTAQLPQVDLGFRVPTDRRWLGGQSPGCSPGGTDP